MGCNDEGNMFNVLVVRMMQANTTFLKRIRARSFNYSTSCFSFKFSFLARVFGTVIINIQSSGI